MAALTLSRELRAAIVAERELVRIEEGGTVDWQEAGGQCAITSDCVSGLLDEQGISGSEPYPCGCYVTDDDRLVWDHCWVDLADGSILDPTADQFCEGDDVRLVTSADPRFGRYLRWETLEQVATDLEARAARLGANRVLGELAELRDYVYMSDGAAEADALARKLQAI
jgi:hypothetical protein